MDFQLHESLLFQETMGRGRPKSLCYEDIIMIMAVRHPVTGRSIPAMAIKFIHHKGADNKPRLHVVPASFGSLITSCPRFRTIFFSSPNWRLIFCVISTILLLALHDKAFDPPSLTDASTIFVKEPLKFRQSIPLRWKKWMP